MSRQNVSYIVPFVPYVKIIVDLVIKAYIRKKSKTDWRTNVRMLYYDRLVIRSNHYAASKALSGVKMLPDFSVPLCGLGKDNYRRLP